MTKKFSRQSVILALLIFSAAFFYLAGIKKNLPYAPEVDERPFWVERAVRMADTLSLNPGFFGHPGSTMFYPMAAAYRVLYGDQAQEMFEHKPTGFYLVGRFLAAGYALMTLPVVFWIGRRLFGSTAGLIGTGLLVVNGLVVGYTQIIRSDMAALFFGMSGIASILYLFQKPGFRSQIISGVVIGIGVSSRYFMVTSAVALLAVDVYLFWRERAQRRAFLAQAAVGMAFILIGFALTTPYFFLDFETALRDIQTEARTVHLGADGLSPLGNFLFYTTEIIPKYLGAAQTIFLLVGIAFVLKARSFPQLLFLGFGAGFIALISILALHWDRWAIQAFPVFHLVAAFGLVSLAQRWRIRGQTLQRVVLGVGVLIIGAQPAYQTTLYTLRVISPSTRILAREWVIQNLHPSDKILSEWYSAILTLSEFQPDEVFSVAVGKTLEDYIAGEYDFLIVSDSIYARYFKEPERYATEVAFYQNLFACGCLAQEFAHSETQGGPTIQIYDLRKLR